jgi:hypothetical protein
MVTGTKGKGGNLNLGYRMMPRSSYDNLCEHPECLKERQPFHEQVTFAFVGYLVLVDLRQRADSMGLGGFLVIAALGEKLKTLAARR